MGEIYKAAAQVIIWLGEGNSETASAFEALGSMGRARLAMYHSRQEEALELALTVSEQSKENISAVFEMPWFYRLWTVQEVALPDVEKVLVCCGKSGYPWDVLLNAGAYIQAHPTMKGRWDEATRLQRLISGRLMAARGQVKSHLFSAISGAPVVDTLSIFIAARQKQSTKPEDRVFSLYSVLKELVSLSLKYLRKLRLLSLEGSVPGYAPRSTVGHSATRFAILGAGLELSWMACDRPQATLSSLQFQCGWLVGLDMDFRGCSTTDHERNFH
ncbi:hypothetical protein LTR07_009968 [Exophiala xenobiotica]|nr:hypothetical protein LTR90_009641 [Exophiala xenobiotica]KAK5504391.1 hypothetical protein LTR21_010528 [Exophiala xenobiotica]KAK5510186.1 hypothetical protein LTR07_009968 [Exophiala xenobiotica]